MKNNIQHLILILLLSSGAFANVTLPTFFSDNMVLQRNAEVTVWGTANPSEEVVIRPSWSKEEYKVKADKYANWSIKIKTSDAGGPYTISFKGYNEVILKNILLGEVWICSGQSNMEMSADWGITNGDEEVRNANYPNIRLFTVPKTTAMTPQNNLPGSWLVCSPETMKHFSAVGYFFGKRLQEDLKGVPIGLISSNWGGTPAEIWTPEQVIRNDETLAEAAKKIVPFDWGPSEPGRAFNAMINPLVGFKIAGVIWYQGESNLGAVTYDKTFGALITSWRRLWNYDFPFYFVQIAPYNYDNDQYGAAIIRNAQRKVVQQLANTGMVVTSDISPTNDIHPKDKKSVGTRLANLALANTYKTYTAVVNGPLYRQMKTEKNKLIVSFDYGEGLCFKNKKSAQFEIAGADGIFYVAEASIKNNTVILQSDKVKVPVKVRFAWRNTTQSDLFNKVNLPASTFISE